MKLGARSFEWNVLFEATFPMCYYLSRRFAPQSGEHHQNSNAFFINQTGTYVNVLNRIDSANMLVVYGMLMD